MKANLIQIFYKSIAFQMSIYRMILNKNNKSILIIFILNIQFGLVQINIGSLIKNYIAILFFQ
ncbi:hypothetical protein pb186bvf_011009 [Paramecium bursaria]